MTTRLRIIQRCRYLLASMWITGLVVFWLLPAIHGVWRQHRRQRLQQ